MKGSMVYSDVSKDTSPQRKAIKHLRAPVSKEESSWDRNILWEENSDLKLK